MNHQSELCRARENTWASQISRHASERPGDIALRYQEASTTWSELHSRIDSLANWLVARGVQCGDRIAIVMTNRPEFLETLYAATSIGAIAVPVNFRLSAQEIAYILTDSGALVVVTEPALLPVVHSANDTAGLAPIVVSTGPQEDPSALAYEGAVDGSAPARSTAVVAASEPAAIMYTSGTTGHPKGAVLTQNNFQAVTEIITRAWKMFEGDEVVLAATPLFHIGGLGSTNGPILLGSTLVILPSSPFDPNAVLDLIGAEHVTATFMVPAQWQAICSVPDAGTRAASLRTLSWGAAPASNALLQQMSLTFPSADIVALFGQTELAPITCVMSGRDAVRKIGSVGKPAFNVSIRVVDEQMRDVELGSVGEIVYRGPNLMLGYWNNDAATEAAFEGGWFHSGDLVRRDEEGFVYVVDRKKDMIISGGENIYSAEVENALAGHPAVADVAVIGRTDARWGEAVVAIVVPADPAAPPTLEQIVDFCRDRLASYKKPRELVIVDALPRNATGKVMKHDLRSTVAAPLVH